MAVSIRRLTKRADFLKIKADGKRVSTQAFVLQYLENKDEKGLGVGFTCSGALGNAVARNRARRRLKAVFDKVCRLNPAARGQGLGLVMVGKMPVFTIDFKYLERDMAKALAEIGVSVE